MLPPSLDALERLHKHFLSQAAEVGDAIAIIRRARAPAPAASAAPESIDLGINSFAVPIEKSDAEGTTIILPNGTKHTLSPYIVHALSIGTEYQHDGYAIALVGTQMRARKIADEP